MHMQVGHIFFTDIFANEYWLELLYNHLIKILYFVLVV